MNKGLKYTLAGLGLVFAAAAVEWDGYDMFDQADGSNPVCRIDPQCRSLRDDEIAEQREIFGNQINYHRVRIFNRRFLGLLNRDFAPNGHIYFDESGYNPLDQKSRIRRRADEAHEMTHVLQHQKGRVLWREAVAEWFRNGFRYDASYKYDIQAGGKFKLYNLEQQANIVEDFTRVSGETALLTLSETSQIKANCDEMEHLSKIMIPDLYAVVPDICYPDRIDVQPLVLGR